MGHKWLVKLNQAGLEDRWGSVSGDWKGMGGSWAEEAYDPACLRMGKAQDVLGELRVMHFARRAGSNVGLDRVSYVGNAVPVCSVTARI